MKEKDNTIYQDLSIIFLALPYFFFFFGWLKIEIAIPLTLLLGACVSIQIRSLFDLNFKKINHFFVNNKILLLIIVCWISLSGVGGIGYQNGDYEKHNAIIHDLINFNWPIKYFIDSKTTPLVYYLGYYIIPGLIGKLTNFALANVLIFCWTFIGVFLALKLFQKITANYSLINILLFVLFSGMDAIGFVITNEHLFKFGDQIEWYARFGVWQYSSNTTLLFWVPQHALVGWISVALLYLSQKTQSLNNVLLIWSLTLLWSPFIFLGLLPFCILIFLTSSNKKSVFSFKNLFGVVVVGIMISYFYAGYRTNISDFVWNYHYSWVENIGKFSLFLIFDLLFFVSLIGRYIYNIPKLKNWFFVAVIFLCILPIYRYGQYNDLVTRSSIPSLFIVLIGISQFLFSVKNKDRNLKKILIGCLIIGSLTPISEIVRSVNNLHTLTDNWKTITNVEGLVMQYIGNNDSFFFYRLAK